MAQEPTMKFNSSSQGFSLGWDAPDVRPKNSKSYYFSNKIQPVETMSSTRGAKFLDKKPLDISAKVGSADIKVTVPELTPKITRNDKERSTFYFGDAPPEQRTFKRREKTQKESQEEAAKYQQSKKLKQRVKKEEIQKLHNQNISKIQQNAKKRQSFRF